MTPIDGSRNVCVYEDLARAADFERRPDQRFDRVAFTLRLVALLSPRNTRIAVFRSRRLEVRQGLDLGRGSDARWAMVGVPEDASAESIALMLTCIESAGEHPYSLDATLGAVQARASAS